MPDISLTKARMIIRKTLAHGRATEMKPLTAVVLDAGGHMIAAEREDGASPGRVRLAEGKAHGAIMLGMPGSAQQARGDAQAYFVGAMNGLYDGRFVPVKGGVLVRDKRGRIIGAVGVTGDTSDNDAAAAQAGIEAAGLIAEI